jgi:crotonobetainyl-CoA:carnitine CoA-transferase CaiB-like acyl-CoA transferase
MNGPLKGITVVSVEQAVAAPYASSRLADAGARVIKVERPEGDFARNYDNMVLGQSAYYVWLNRGKESVCIDIKAAVDQELLERLIAHADVLIQNLKPGSMERLGYSSASLRARYPRLISCEISGFGYDGKFSHLKAYDLIVQAEVGLCSITGNAAGPARVGVSVCDIAAGMSAHAAILQALYHRERTGEGASIHVSLFDAVADWMNVPVLQHLHAGHESLRAGINHPSIAPYGAYRCSDGKEIVFSVQNSREWVALCERFLRRPELIESRDFGDNMARLANRRALDEIVAARFQTLSSSQAMDELEEAGLAYGRLNDVEALSRHPHARMARVSTPAGGVDVIAPPAIVDGKEPELGAVAGLGQHSQAIRSEFLARG